MLVGDKISILFKGSTMLFLLLGLFFRRNPILMNAVNFWDFSKHSISPTSLTTCEPFAELGIVLKDIVKCIWSKYHYPEDRLFKK